ncbi:MAG: hypothetical protein R2867_40845 [Caldilineaceae bacterium]
MPNLFGQHYSKRVTPGFGRRCFQVANARKATLMEGIERGADLIEVFNASGLCFSILPGRAGCGVGALQRDVALLSAATPVMWGQRFMSHKAMAGCAAFLGAGAQLRHDLYRPSRG